MQKPLSIAREEFGVNLVNCVRESGLPACIVLDVLRLVTNEVAEAAKRQYDEDKQAFESEERNEQ